MLSKSPSEQTLTARRKPLPTHGFLLILLIIFVAFKLVLALALPQSAVFASDLTIDNILSAVNSQRSQRNLVTLNTDSRLSSAAQSKADDMQARHYFAHVDPDGNYIWPKIVAAGYTPYLELGENLAIEFYDTDSLISAWMNSPTHRANILNDGFQDQGMGLDFGDANSGQYHSVVANTFGTLLLAKKVEAAPQTTKFTPTTASGPAVSGASEKTPTQTAPKNTAQPKPKAPPTAPPAAAQPEPEATSAPATTTAQNNPAPAPEPVANPVNPRGDYAMGLSPSQPEASTAQAQTSQPVSSSSPPALTTAPAIVNTESQNPLANFQTNRYFTLAFGIVLFLFLLTDLRGIMKQKSELVGKKINNLTLLFLALVVIAMMYWL